MVGVSRMIRVTRSGPDQGRGLRSEAPAGAGALLGASAPAVAACISGAAAGDGCVLATFAVPFLAATI